MARIKDMVVMKDLGAALTEKDMQDAFDKMASDCGRPSTLLYGLHPVDMTTGRKILDISFKKTSKKVAYLDAAMKGMEVGDLYWNKDKKKLEIWDGGDKSHSGEESAFNRILGSVNLGSK